MRENKNETDWIRGSLKGALAEAMAEEYDWVPDPETLEYTHAFPPDFEKKMEAAACAAERSYVSVGHHRIRRAVAAALIAALILAMTAGAVAIQRILVTWNETQNGEAGTLDVTFDVDDPNGQTGEFRYMKPQTPEGYEVVREEKGIKNYSIEYSDNNGKIIMYFQSGPVDTMSVSLDNEDADFHEVVVNGYKGYSYSKMNNNALYWTDGIYMFDIGGNCDMETLWQMAESIK